MAEKQVWLQERAKVDAAVRGMHSRFHALMARMVAPIIASAIMALSITAHADDVPHVRLWSWFDVGMAVGQVDSLEPNLSLIMPGIRSTKSDVAGFDAGIGIGASISPLRIGVGLSHMPFETFGGSLSGQTRLQGVAGVSAAAGPLVLGVEAAFGQAWLRFDGLSWGGWSARAGGSAAFIVDGLSSIGVYIGREMSYYTGREPGSDPGVVDRLVYYEGWNFLIRVSIEAP